jgi:hypothetical protein
MVPSPNPAIADAATKLLLCMETGLVLTVVYN